MRTIKLQATQLKYFDKFLAMSSFFFYHFMFTVLRTILGVSGRNELLLLLKCSIFWEKMAC